MVADNQDPLIGWDSLGMLKGKLRADGPKQATGQPQGSIQDLF
ncbi:hypothetical protein [Synechococcus sp. CS-1327]|nr:hypothetical protein [Synechococcus sp. CS-1327]